MYITIIYDNLWLEYGKLWKCEMLNESGISRCKSETNHQLVDFHCWNYLTCNNRILHPLENEFPIVPGGFPAIKQSMWETQQETDHLGMVCTTYGWQYWAWFTIGFTKIQQYPIVNQHSNCNFNIGFTFSKGQPLTSTVESFLAGTLQSHQSQSLRSYCRHLPPIPQPQRQAINSAARVMVMWGKPRI